jgi:hypothetical protein
MHFCPRYYVEVNSQIYVLGTLLSEKMALGPRRTEGLKGPRDSLHMMAMNPSEFSNPVYPGRSHSLYLLSCRGPSCILEIIMRVSLRGILAFLKASAVVLFLVHFFHLNYFHRSDTK